MAHVPLAPTATLAETRVTAPAGRLAFLDNLRTLVIAVVILHHAGQPYGPTGGFWPIFNPTRAAILGPFFSVNAAFGMGLMFLLAGYLVPHAYERKGFGRFLGDRLIRLGVPLLVISLGVFLPIAYGEQGQGHPFGAFFISYLARPELGHLWFVSLLILFIVGYALWRVLRVAVPPPRPNAAAPSNLAILGFTLGLAAATFLAHLRYAPNVWLNPAPFVRIEPAHLPQYLSFFVVGAAAARRGWLLCLPARTGSIWLLVGLGAAGVIYAQGLFGWRIPLPLPAGFGEANRVALVSSVIETSIAVGLSIGLLTLFRDHVRGGGWWSRELAAASYLTYLIHLFVVVGLQMALADAPLPPLAKFAIVGLLAVPLCFLPALGLRRLPGARRVV